MSQEDEDSRALGKGWTRVADVDGQFREGKNAALGSEVSHVSSRADPHIHPTILDGNPITPHIKNPVGQRGTYSSKERETTWELGTLHERPSGIDGHNLDGLMTHRFLVTEWKGSFERSDESAHDLRMPR